MLNLMNCACIYAGFGDSDRGAELLHDWHNDLQFLINPHEIWGGTSRKIGCKPGNCKVEILSKFTTWINPWNLCNTNSMFRINDTLCLIFNFNQDITSVKTYPGSWFAGIFIINSTWFMTERVVVFVPFIRSCLDMCKWRIQTVAMRSWAVGRSPF